MTGFRSFRSRLLFGALLAALGMLAISHVVSIFIMHQHRIVLTVGGSTILVTIAVACVIVGIAQVRSGLSPFDELRARLSAVRDGRARLVEGRYPTEVQPLVNDLNAFLAHREQIVRRALATAGDLAHGLKTPLAVLSQETERARGAGQPELAAALDLQVERMRRQVDYHLAHARAAASGATPGARCSVLDAAQALARTLLRLHADRGIGIDVDIVPGLWVRGGREDLDEMLGNLLDNACKWARSRVSVTARELVAGTVVITVDDDGPGIAPEMREVVLQRGVRADEAAPGSGLGLAIVCDLAELYGGSLTLGAAPSGGLRVCLQLTAG